MTFWDNSTIATVITGETTTANLVLVIRGDLNSNCVIDIGNVAKTANMYLKRISKTPEDIKIVDFNLNEGIDIGDVAKIANYWSCIIFG